MQGRQCAMDYSSYTHIIRKCVASSDSGGQLEAEVYSRSSGTRGDSYIVYIGIAVVSI